MDEYFSWFTIEVEDGCYCLYFHNKKGVNRIEARRDTLEEIEQVKARREAYKASVGEKIAQAIKWAIENPEEFKQRMNKGD